MARTLMDRLHEQGQAEIAREMLRLRQENQDLRVEITQLTQAIAGMYAQAKAFLAQENGG